MRRRVLYLLLSAMTGMAVLVGCSGKKEEKLEEVSDTSQTQESDD